MQKILRIDRQGHPDRRNLASPPSVELEILRGAARVRRRPVNGPVFLIGAADDCDLVLGDGSIPEVHTYVYVSADGVSIRHLGAAPVLRVEGRIIEAAQLYDGDRFEIEPFEFLVEIGPSAGDRRHAEDESRSSGNRQELLDGGSAGMTQARQLADDIRCLLSGGREALRLYVEPEFTAPNTCRSLLMELLRASA